jgi:hypothetical protein
MSIAEMHAVRVERCRRPGCRRTFSASHDVDPVGPLLSGFAAESGVGDQVVMVTGGVRAGAPSVHLDDSGLEEVGAVEEPTELGS